MQLDLKLALEALDGMIAQQTDKVLQVGRRWVPYATHEDLRNAEDFPQLKDKPMYHYEEGILAGYISARMALANISMESKT